MKHTVLTAQQMIYAIKSFDDSQKKELGRALSRLAAEPGFEGVIHSAASTAGLDAISNVLLKVRDWSAPKNPENGLLSGWFSNDARESGWSIPVCTKASRFCNGDKLPHE